MINVVPFFSNVIGERCGKTKNGTPVTMSKDTLLNSRMLLQFFFGSQLERTTRFMLATGQPFPNFSLPNQDGKTTKLSDFAGDWLVVYFYPKDDTPGCTIQGKSFTASKEDFDAAGIKIVGISADDAASHKNFCTKFGFTIELLADTDASLMKALGLGQSEWKGMKFWERTTFVVDPKGIVRKVYEKVNPEGHEKTLLADIKRLQS